MTAFVVVNPTSAGGRTARDWPRIKAELESMFPLMTVAVSHARGETASLVRAALRAGHLDIIVVGGDGTINEAVNGFFEHGETVSSDAVLGFVTSAMGGDFRRSFGIAAGPEAAIARLRQSHIRRVDVGRLSCLSLDGMPLTRHFINVASFGLSGRVARRSNRGQLARVLGGSAAFNLHAMRALAFWHPPHVRLMTDTGYDEIAGVTAVAIANGRWFAGGLRIAPYAEPGDGLFDIVVMSGASRRRIVKALARLRGGTYPGEPAVRTVRAARLTAASTVDTQGPVEIETDGESAGLLPATFEILPLALNLRC